MPDLSNVRTELLQQELSQRRREETISRAAYDISTGLHDLLRSVVKGDGGEDFAETSRNRIRDGIITLMGVK